MRPQHYASGRRAHPQCRRRMPMIPLVAEVEHPNRRAVRERTAQPVTRTAPWYSAAYQGFERLEIWTTPPVWGASMKFPPPM